MSDERAYSVKRILDRIDRSVRFANGIFLKNAVVFNRQEKEAFNLFLKRKDGAFEVVLKDGTSLMRTTHIYASLRNINIILMSNFEKLFLARAAIWSAFIVQNEIDLSLPNGEFNYLNSPAVLDDFVSDYEGFFGVVITIPQRVKSIKCPVLIPQALHSKWSERIFRNLINNLEIVATKSTRFHLIETHLLDGAIWPEDEEDCHSDKRVYPFLDEEITGLDKWKYDQYILGKGGSIPLDYKFGIYPK